MAREFLETLKNNLIMTQTVNRQYDSLFTNLSGDTIRIPRPVRLRVQQGPVISGEQGIEQQYENLVMDQWLTVAVTVTQQQWTLQLSDFSKIVLEPAAISLGNAVDSLLYSAGALAAYNYVGVAGNAPASFNVLAQAHAKLNSFGVASRDRYLLLSEFDGASMYSTLYNSFNPMLNKDIIYGPTLGNILNFDTYSAQNVQRPVSATLSGLPVTNFGTPIVSGANQSGTNLVVTGFTPNITLNPGLVFEIANTNAVNISSYNDTGSPANFVITQTTVVDGSGNATLPIYPAITPTGSYQNVLNTPPNGALITCQQTATKNLAYNREGFTLAVAKLAVPPTNENIGAYFNVFEDADAKISIQMTRQFNAFNMTDLIRFDILCAPKCFADYVCIVQGS